MKDRRESFQNAFVAELLRKYIGRGKVSVATAAELTGLSESRFRKAMEGTCYLRVTELLSLIEHPDLHSLLGDLVRPAGYVVKRPMRLNNPCPHVASTKFAQATAKTVTASEDGVIDHLELPDVANANRQASDYWDSYLVS